MARSLADHWPENLARQSGDPKETGLDRMVVCKPVTFHLPPSRASRFVLANKSQ
jgi:hypothetical protein